MGIWLDRDSRIAVQGLTGRNGQFHARQMLDYGTPLVGGVTPGKGGQRFKDSVPIFDTVAESVKETGANVSVIFVPPPFAADAIMEAVAKMQRNPECATVCDSLYWMFGGLVRWKLINMTA